MNVLLRVLLVLCAAAWMSAQVMADPPVAVKLTLDPKTMSFRHPKTGDLFTLHLGDALTHATGGITEVPRNVKGFRDATSSYYEPTGEGGCGYACAESALTRENTHWLQFVEIQYQPDSGCILITEDKSDASPCVRHILFTPGRHGGYDVTYLSPKSVVVPKNVPAEFHELPSKIKLLPGNRAEVNGKVVRLKDIPQSAHPFSIGG